MKRMENVSRSPCISLTTSVIQGLSTIHAYDKRAQYIETYDKNPNAKQSEYVFYYSVKYYLVLSSFPVCDVTVSLIGLKQ